MVSDGSERKTARIVLSRCMKTGRDFGIRFEKSGSGMWIATWSFKIPASQKGKSEYNGKGDTLSGELKFPENYPGCPHCKGGVTVLCPGCGKLFCHDIEKGINSKCPWCNKELQIRYGQLGPIKVASQGDR